MAEAPISNLFPAASAPRAAEPASRPAPAAKPVENKKPSKFEHELKAGSTERSQQTAKSPKDLSEKPTADRGDRQVLQPLRKVAAKNKQAVDSAPVVALLTGKLDRLSPKSIPELVSGNDFVASALGEGELESFMAKPMPIGDLLESLGMPTEVLAEAANLGLDLAAIVSPNEILRALGLDPQRVFVELKQLKDNLTLDGLQSYMQRATMMQRAGSSDTGMRPDGLQQQRLSREVELARNAAERVPQRGTPNLTLGDSLGNTPSITSSSQTNSPTRQASLSGLALDQLAPWQIAAGISGGSPVNLDSAQFNSASTASFLSQNPELQAGGASNRGSATNLSSNLAAMTMTGTSQLAALNSGNDPLSNTTDTAKAVANANLAADSIPGLDSSPKMNRASYDAFASMGDQLRSDDTIRIENSLDPNLTRSSINDNLVTQPQNSSQVATDLDRLLRDLSVIQQNPGQITANAQTNLLKPASVAVVQDALLTAQLAESSAQLENIDAEMLDMSEDRRSDSQWISMLTNKSPDAVAPAAPRVSLDDLTRTLVLDQGQPDKDRDSEPQDSESDASAGFDTNRLFESLGHVTQSGTKTTRNAEFLSHLSGPTTALSTQERGEIMRQIVDRATFLAKDGGGIVRLDISNPDVGTLELAVNMQNDRLDLRIITSSDRARDMMAGEMSQLRDALSVQNLQLGSVEVGVGRRDADRSNDLFNTFQQNNSARQFGDSNERRERARNWEGDVNDRARSLRAIGAANTANLPSYARMPVMPTADGRIAVRA